LLLSLRLLLAPRPLDAFARLAQNLRGLFIGVLSHELHSPLGRDKKHGQFHVHRQMVIAT
jgi:hypothetical protein